MKYLKYIFSDRKAFAFWFILFFGVFIHSWLSIILHYETRKPNWIGISDFMLCFIVIIVFICFYTGGYFNLKKHEKFLRKYSNLINTNSIHEIDVIVHRNKYTAKPLKSNRGIMIKPKPKNDRFKAFLFEDNIGILGQTFDLGVFRRHIKPIIISLNDYENNKRYRFAKTPKISSINHIDNDLEIIFKSSVYGIRKVLLKEWKNNLQPLTQHHQKCGGFGGLTKFCYLRFRSTV